MEPRTPAVLVHQNMRTFAGDTSRLAARVRAYEGMPPSPPEPLPDTWPLACPAQNAVGFPAVAAETLHLLGVPGRSICALGLTELTNVAGTASVAARLGQALFGAGPQVYVFNCGVTALSRSEYTAIVLPRWVDVCALGRIVTGGTDGHDIAAPSSDAALLQAAPTVFVADYRFVVYVVAQVHEGRPPVAVGFIHNVYREKDNRVSTALRMPWLLERIMHHRGWPPRHVYVGGDFNVEPHASFNPDPRYPAYAHSASTGPATPPRFRGGTPGGTTWGGNTYDYWVSDLPRETPNLRPAISTATWDGPRGLMSDHVATLLRIA